MQIRPKRTAVVLGVSGALLAPVALVAHAAVVSPSTERAGKLVQVGPIADNGFPTWYRDSNGLRLEACTDLVDPLCSTLPDEVPAPDQPISYPENFPGEFFYQLAGAEVSAGAAGTVDVGLDLEGAWAAEEVREGDQMVFGRIRIRARDAADATYRITHPYGVDEFVAAGGEGIDMTEDIGASARAFGGALNSRVGPFLTWDTFGTTGAGAPPAGYVGDPAVPHRVKGSPYGTNLVKVEQKVGSEWVALGQTDLFTVQGRLAVNDGVDVQQATYRTMPDGTKVVEVFATSEAGESIKMVAPALGYRGITLEEDSFTVVTGPTSSHQEGRYYGRFAVTNGARLTGGADATKIVVQNAGDVPVASKTLSLSDVVTVTAAAYDGAQLTVEATSSDPAADLTVTGYGPLTDGALTVTDVDAPPYVITVTSNEGGTATVPLGSTGSSFTLPDPPVAAVNATPTRPIVNQPVTLDATGSLDATSFEWSVVGQPAGTAAIVLSGSKPVFTPTRPGLHEFSVVAVGDSGRSAAQSVSVQVVGAAVAVTATTGPAQTVNRGAKVTLDGSQSIGAATYLWEQLSNVAGQAIPADQKVTLSGESTAKPTFTMPLMALPAAPGPNAAYSATAATPLRFRLTVTGVDGRTTAVRETTVKPTPETLTITEARYRTRGEWRVSGTSDVKAGQRVAIVFGSRVGANGAPAPISARGVVIGYATVDGLGAWSYVGAGPNASTGGTVTAVSAQGSQRIGNIAVTA